MPNNNDDKIEEMTIISVKDLMAMQRFLISYCNDKCDIKDKKNCGDCIQNKIIKKIDKYLPYGNKRKNVIRVAGEIECPNCKSKIGIHYKNRNNYVGYGVCKHCGLNYEVRKTWDDFVKSSYIKVYFLVKKVYSNRLDKSGKF